MNETNDILSTQGLVPSCVCLLDTSMTMARLMRVSIWRPTTKEILRCWWASWEIKWNFHQNYFPQIATHQLWLSLWHTIGSSRLQKKLLTNGSQQKRKYWKKLAHTAAGLEKNPEEHTGKEMVEFHIDTLLSVVHTKVGFCMSEVWGNLSAHQNHAHSWSRGVMWLCCTCVLYDRVPCTSQYHVVVVPIKIACIKVRVVNRGKGLSGSEHRTGGPLWFGNIFSSLDLKCQDDAAWIIE